MRKLALLGLVVAMSGPASADQLMLDGGGVVETNDWWIEGETLFYRSSSGTVGLPRSLVLRVVTTSRPPDGEAPTEPTRQPAAAVQRSSAPRVSKQVASRMREANQALTANEYERAASLYFEVMSEVELDVIEPRVGYALAQLKLGEDDLALSVVLDGLSRDPRQPALLELLGNIRNREERVQDALRAWRDAFGESPNDRLRDKILKAERELHAGRDYALSMSSHFNLRYDGEVDEALAEAVSGYLEQQYWSMADAFDLAPRQPITVVLYPTRQFREVTQMPEWVGGLYDGKIRVPIAGLARINPGVEGLLRHELAHAFIHAKSRGHCPRWLHEGLAQIFEQRATSPRDRQTIVQRLRQVEAPEWDAAGFSYPLALSLTQHLVKRRGLHGLVRVLELLGQGLELDPALSREFGGDYRSLCRSWGAEVLQQGMR